MWRSLLHCWVVLTPVAILAYRDMHALAYIGCTVELGDVVSYALISVGDSLNMVSSVM